MRQGVCTFDQHFKSFFYYMKVFCTAFIWFVIIWREEIGTKSAREILVTLTKGIYAEDASIFETK